MRFCQEFFRIFFKKSTECKQRRLRTAARPFCSVLFFGFAALFPFPGFFFGEVGGVVAGRAANLFALAEEVFAAFGALFSGGHLPAHELAARILRTTIKDLARLALHAARGRAADGAGARKLGDGLTAAAFGTA